MIVRLYGLSVRGKAGALALGLAALAVGGVFLALGLALLLGLGLVGTALGAGVLLYRKLTGRDPIGLLAPRRSAALDPRDEVFSPARRPVGLRGASPPESVSHPVTPRADGDHDRSPGRAGG